MIETHPISCDIDSSAESLFETLSLELIERESTALLTPTAAKWRTLARGDEIRVRLGLAGADLTDYGTFAVDTADLGTEGNNWRSRIQARTAGAIALIETPVRESLSPANQRWWDGRRLSDGAMGSDSSTDWNYQDVSARSLARDALAAIGLALRWEADDYLAWLNIGPDTTAGNIIDDLMQPLRLPRLYRGDAFLDGGAIVVRRRDWAAVAGTLNCGLGTISAIAREPQRNWETIIVSGAAFDRGGMLVPNVSQEGGDSEWWPPGMIETETSEIIGPEGEVVRTTTTKSYQPVLTADFAFGQVLRSSVTVVETTDTKGDKKTEIKSTQYAYDFAGCLVRENEETTQDGKPTGYSVIQHTQATPTDVRTSTTEWGYDWGGKPYIKRGYPRSETRAGTLQSSVKQKQQRRRWRIDFTEQEDSDGADTYLGTVERGVGEGVRRENISVLGGDAACLALAQMLADECGKVLYTAELAWPRPLLYRRGQIVALTNLPGGAPDVERAAIAAVRTRYDVEAAIWEHAVSLEWWADG